MPDTIARWRPDLLLVWLLILLYVINFSALSVLQNDAFGTTDHDLGVMDQAAWNTLHGRFVMESSQEGRLQSRLRGHVEPIFLLVSLVYLLYDHVNALLILQSVVIALGALPLYWLGRGVAEGRFGRVLGLAAALVYLLYPPLEAANLTEFHPVALAPTLFLFAFHYLQQRSYWRYAAFALLALSCKEDMSLTLAMLGAYMLIAAAWQRRSGGPAAEGIGRLSGQAIRWGLFTLAVSALWFYGSVYVVVPRFSATGDYQLFQRYAELGGGPTGVLSTLLRQPQAVVGLLVDRARVSYVGGLLAGVGFLALLSPLTLLMALPSLTINLLSSYSVMYSGVSHYSAPLAPWLVISAVYGVAWLRGRLMRLNQAVGRIASALVLLWLVGWGLGYHVAYGFTPLGGRFRVPQVTQHNHLAQRFLAQIPADARLSTQPALFPHASHRQFIYEFPIVADAEYVWLDVTSAVAMHPNDFHQAYNRLVSDEGFGLLDAADGYILLKRGASGLASLPDGFYSFARAGGLEPQHFASLDFGDSIHLVGFDLYETWEDGRAWTGLRTYWQALKPLPGGLRLYPFFFDDQGTVVEDTSQRPIVTALWYPPERWAPGEIVLMDKLPWPVGDRFNLGLGVVAGGEWRQVEDRLPIRQPPTPNLRPGEGTIPVADGGTWAYLATGERRDGNLVVATVRRSYAVPIMQYALGANLGGKAVLLGYDIAVRGREIVVTLYWRAASVMDRSYTVFLHLEDGAGRGLGQSDGLPAARARPTDAWASGEVIADRRTVLLPEGAPGGPYRLLAGMYLLETLERLPVLDESGAVIGDSVDLGIVPVR